MAGRSVAVLDFGSFTSKVGFSGEAHPRCEYHSVVSKAINQQQDVTVGDDAWSCRGAVPVHYPIHGGLVTNWEAFEKMLYHSFTNYLRVNCRDTPVLLAEPVCNPRANREMLTKILFENLNVPAVLLKAAPVLSLMSCGLVSGLVVESGHDETITVPVYEGCILPHALQHLPLGGKDITFKLQTLLHGRGEVELTRSYEDTIRDLKEKLCYVAQDFNTEHSASDLEKYELPDGRVIIVSEERYRCPECLFQPELENLGHAGIHELAYYSVRKCDNELRKLMYENIIVSGGNTLFPGLTERLQTEISKLANANDPRTNDPTATEVTVKVTKPDSGKYSAWQGASILASCPSFYDMVITAEEYDEYGPGFIHTKCFQ